MKRIFSIFFLLMCFSAWGWSQFTWKDRLYVEANYHYGFLIPSVKSIEYFITDHIDGYQLNIGLLSNGRKQWQLDYNYPRMGFGFYHSGLGNNAIYGKVNALFFYVDRNFLPLHYKFNISNRLEYGLGYVTKVNDLETNPFNIAISSHINVFLRYSVQLLYQITPLVEVNANVGFSHLSNGRFYEPNKGLNFITSSVGLHYSLQNPKTCIVPQVDDEKNLMRNNKVVFTFGAGEKQLFRKQTDRYAVAALSAEYSHRLFSNGFVGLALNTYYDKSVRKEMEYAGNTSSPNDSWRVSLNLLYEVEMGRFSYLFQPGIYLKNSFKEEKNISNRLCVRYALTNHWLASVAVKAHWVSIADFVEWGVAYKL